MRAIPTGERYTRDAAGFTLVEMMVGLTLGAIGAAVLFSIFIGTQSTYVDTQEQAFGGGDTRAAIGMLAQEVRSAGSDGRNIGIQRLSVASSDSLRILSDLDADGVIETTVEPSEDVVYFYDSTSGTLQRDPGTGAVVMMSNLESFSFEYFDAQGDPVGNGGSLNLQDRGRIRAVRFDMTMGGTRDGVPSIHLETVATMRNEGNI
jgi:prepilin-type N-terminal cleavage/methylation domain-containing protein